MKKNITIVLIILLILTCGGLLMNQKLKKDEQIKIKYLDQVKQDQEPYIEKYIRYYFNNIDTISLTTTEQIPTGAITIKGFINDNEKLDFTAFIDNPKPGSNIGLSYGEEFYELTKPESETPAKNMEEILKEERKKKRAEEKTSSTQNWFNI